MASYGLSRYLTHDNLPTPARPYASSTYPSSVLSPVRYFS